MSAAHALGAPAIPSLTMEEVWHRVGRPSKPGAMYFRSYERASIYAWEDELNGLAGWGWAIACSDIVVDHGWTGGDRRDRDGEIARALEDLEYVIEKRGVA